MERSVLSIDEWQLEEKSNDWVVVLEAKGPWSIACSCVAIVTGASDGPRTETKKH